MLPTVNAARRYDVLMLASRLYAVMERRTSSTNINASHADGVAVSCHQATQSTTTLSCLEAYFHNKRHTKPRRLSAYKAPEARGADQAVATRRPVDAGGIAEVCRYDWSLRHVAPFLTSSGILGDQLVTPYIKEIASSSRRAVKLILVLTPLITVQLTLQ
jgi:hypothetical protein